ncbi:MAG: hypothetical protein H6555_05260 [Lewinellaceae bacterium]|nr:hypothetical protein [Lewinellaceae bacterium]
MGLIQSIRLRLRNKYLFNQLNQRRREARQPVNFSEALNIGILFNATELATRTTVLAYADQLREQGKRVKTLGFFDSKQEDPNFTFRYYNLKNIDWALRPNGANVTDFCDHTFDVLINLNPVSDLHAEYIAALTPAHLKVGPITEHTYAYDVMIDVANKQGLAGFIQEMEVLLKKTNTRHEAAQA